MFMQQNRHIIRNNITIPTIATVVSTNWIIKRQDCAYAKVKKKTMVAQDKVKG